MTKSPPITITSRQLRELVEDQLGSQISDELWNRAEPYARRKLNINRERTPEVDYFDNMYLVLLTADTVNEMDFSDYTLARSMAMMASRAETKGATI